MSFDPESSLTKEQQLKHPEWVGKAREVKQMIQEEFYETGVFV
jgi:hypothetical protein